MAEHKSKGIDAAIRALFSAKDKVIEELARELAGERAKNAKLREAAAPFAAFRSLIKGNGTGPIVTYTEKFKDGEECHAPRASTIEVEDFDRIVAALAER